MGKDSALGHDPLNWMKVVKEGKKSVSLGDVNAADQNTTRSDQPSGPRITEKQQIPYPAKDDKPPHIQKQAQPADTRGNRADSASAPKQKVVIGRLYEKPSAEKTKSIPAAEGVFKESGAYVGPTIPASMRVQPIRRNEPEIHRMPFSVPAERTTTYIVVAYTALLLILGYFVYNDLSKRTSKIEARLFAIEKALRSKQH
ncbi:MAG: hypothetical protein F9K48_03455 [Candidatus Brocadia sp.]|nr:MAG: hypothetical protein F9K48_03455 [Candidatus Brocadia sp.]